MSDHFMTCDRCKALKPSGTMKLFRLPAFLTADQFPFECFEERIGDMFFCYFWVCAECWQEWNTLLSKWAEPVEALRTPPAKPDIPAFPMCVVATK